MPSFTPNPAVSTTFTCAQGTWISAGGAPITVDTKRAAIFRENFVRGGKMTEVADLGGPTDDGGVISRVRTSGRQLVNDSGALPVLKGFNIHAIADWPQSTFDQIYALGARMLRVIVRWDDFEPTSGTIASGPLAALDHTIARAAAAGLYTMIDLHLISGGYPSWTSAVAAEEIKYSTYGAYFTRFMANRYGNTASPQYSLMCIGMGPNELPVSDNTIRNGTGSIPYLENIHRTWITWMRGYAANWIAFVCYGYASQSPLADGSVNPAMTEASPTAYNAVGGNVVIDLHDYFAGDTRTSSPMDGRQFNGQLYPVWQGGTWDSDNQVWTGGGPEIGAGDLGAYDTATHGAQHIEYLQPYTDFCTAANIPLMIGEWSFPAYGKVSWNIGEQQYIADKQAAWATTGAVARLQWNYDVTNNYAVNPFSSRPSGNWKPAVLAEVSGAATFLKDETFAGTAAALSTKAGWTQLLDRAGHLVDGSAHLYAAPGSATDAWTYATAAATVEQEVRGQFRVLSTGAFSMGVAAAMSTTQKTAYVGAYRSDTGRFSLWKIVNGGAPVELGGMTFLLTPSPTDLFSLTLQRTADNWLSFVIDEFVIVSVQDVSSPITGAGRGGVWSSGNWTSTTGTQMLRWQHSNAVYSV